MYEVKQLAHPTRWAVIKTDLATGERKTIDRMKSWGECNKWIERDARDDRETAKGATP